jgi:hypothetical protein
VVTENDWKDKKRQKHETRQKTKGATVAIPMSVLYNVSYLPPSPGNSNMAITFSNLNIIQATFIFFSELYSCSLFLRLICLRTFIVATNNVDTHFFTSKTGCRMRIFLIYIAQSSGDDIVDLSRRTPSITMVVHPKTRSARHS